MCIDGPSTVLCVAFRGLGSHNVGMSEEESYAEAPPEPWSSGAEFVIVSAIMLLWAAIIIAGFWLMDRVPSF